MNKKNLMYLAVFVILAAVAFFVTRDQASGTIRQELRDFAVKNASKDVDKIFLADMAGNTSTLEKKNDRWYINGDVPANASRVRTLLETMERVEVRNPVPEIQKERVLKEIAAEGTKVEIFSKGNHVKTYYVGGTTHDETGTMMLLENSSMPFVVHIPGFFGYLSSRYFAIAGEWRTRELFPFRINEITEVSIDYPQKKEYSFKLTAEGQKYTLHKMDGTTSTKEIPVEDARMYLAGFNNLQFENYVDHLRGENATGIFNEQAPIALITVKTSNQERVLRVFPKPLDERSKLIVNKEVDLATYSEDPEKRWAIFEHEVTEVIQVQNLTFDRIFRIYPEFD